MKPRVGLDVRMINNSGIGTTIRGLLNHWSLEQIDRLVLFGDRDTMAHYPCDKVDATDPVYSLRQHWRYGRLLNRSGLSFYHMPHFDVPLSYRGKLIVTVHDIIHFLFPDLSTKPFTKVYSRILLRHVTRRASKIIAVSENTCQDLIRHFPDAAEKTVVLNPAIDAAYRPATPPEMERVLAHHKLAAGYLLYVGNLRPSKNTMGLINAYSKLRRERSVPTLVLVGKSFYPEFERGGFPKGVHHLGTVPHEHLPALYSAASLFVFPSFYEGFGLPPLEAMACGTPVLTSSRGSLPEVCGDAAAYIDPTSEDSLARSISELLGSPERRHQLRSRGLEQVKKFSWQAFADGTWKVYEEVCPELRG